MVIQTLEGVSRIDDYRLLFKWFCRFAPVAIKSYGRIGYMRKEKISIAEANETPFWKLADPKPAVSFDFLD